MKLENVRWGILGCGDVCERKSGPPMYKTAHSSLVAVMRRDRERLLDFARRHGVARTYTDADALIADPEVDIVYIATPPASHRELTLRVLAAGKPVYVEKPMAMTYAECREMIAAADRARQPLFVAYYRRALPYFVKARELLDAGAIGTPLTVEVRYLRPAAPEDRDAAERRVAEIGRQLEERQSRSAFLFGKHAPLPARRDRPCAGLRRQPRRALRGGRHRHGVVPLPFGRRRNRHLVLRRARSRARRLDPHHRQPGDAPPGDLLVRAAGADYPRRHQTLHLRAARAHPGPADRHDRRRAARRGTMPLDGRLGGPHVARHGPDPARRSVNEPGLGIDRRNNYLCPPMEKTAMTTYTKEERFDAATVEALKEHYAAILRLLGEDPAREGLLKTPERVAKAMSFLTKGYDENPLEIIRSATFREEYKQMVLVKDIELYSLCEHHMLPFYGKAHVAYIPNGYITGLSKIARVVECFARRLQVQERLTVQIRDCIQEALAPMGVAVVIEASHMCMQMRGIEKQQSATTTSAFTGIFLSDHRTREEFMTLISHRYR